MSVRFWCCLIAAAGLAGLAVPPASAYTILAPGSVVAGMSIADWTAAWWTWNVQSPAATYPSADPTGAFANQHNNGPVFFVAGTTGGAATRSFNVPAGRPLLIPIINFFDTEPAEIDLGVTLPDRITAAEKIVAAWPGNVIPASLFASIDGNAVVSPLDYFEETAIFSAGPTQPGSFIGSLGVPDGADIFPTKAAGYWLMVEGLTPGLHELHFGGSANGFSVDTGTPVGSENFPAFSNEVTATIDVVVAEPTSALLILPALLALLALLRLSLGDPRKRSGRIRNRRHALAGEG